MRILAVIGFLTIVTGVAGLAYFFGGFYNVAALEPDNKIVAWALGHVREASIEMRAPNTAPLALDDPAIIQAGARAFAKRGCVTCHGAPGADRAKFSEGMRPDPADLEKVAKTQSAGEIFWVVKNGINMTGMPSFARIKAEDREIWTIAAFVKKLPAISPEDYNMWSGATSP
ncbi:MAG: cytochrome c [Rhodomicrobium sp.]